MTTLKTDYKIMYRVEDNLSQIEAICQENKLNFAMGYLQQPSRPSMMPVDIGYWIRILDEKTHEKFVNIKGRKVLREMLSEPLSFQHGLCRQEQNGTNNYPFHLYMYRQALVLLF